VTTAAEFVAVRSFRVPVLVSSSIESAKSNAVAVSSPSMLNCVSLAFAPATAV